MKYSLYYFSSCPFCIKTRVQLRLLGVSVSLKNIKRNKVFKEVLIAGGGKKQVPCLQIENETTGSSEWLYESVDIVNYFKRKREAEI